MFRKYCYSFLFLVIVNTNYTMELIQDTQDTIFSYALSDWHNNTTTLQTAAAIQCTCKRYAPINKMAQLMNIDTIDKNILLMRIAQIGIPCLVKYAIAQKADLNCVEKPLGYTPLSSAIISNNYKCCQILLEAGADVNKNEEDEEDITSTSKCTDVPYLSMSYCPIHLAAKNNNLKITKLLIAHKVNVNATTDFNDHALEIVYKSPHKNLESIELLNLLIQHGAGPDWIVGVMGGIHMTCEELGLNIQKNIQRKGSS